MINKRKYNTRSNTAKNTSKKPELDKEQEQGHEIQKNSKKKYTKKIKPPNELDDDYEVIADGSSTITLEGNN